MQTFTVRNWLWIAAPASIRTCMILGLLWLAVPFALAREFQFPEAAYVGQLNRRVLLTPGKRTRLDFKSVRLM